VDRALLLSILSMDSYNRGYSFHVKELENVSRLGTVSISSQSNIDPNSLEYRSGFYGISYTVGSGYSDLAAGQSIIAYRGTNPVTCPPVDPSI